MSTVTVETTAELILHSRNFCTWIEMQVKSVRVLQITDCECEYLHMHMLGFTLSIAHEKIFCCCIYNKTREWLISSPDAGVQNRPRLLHFASGVIVRIAVLPQPSNPAFGWQIAFGCRTALCFLRRSHLFKSTCQKGAMRKEQGYGCHFSDRTLSRALSKGDFHFFAEGP